MSQIQLTITGTNFCYQLQKTANTESFIIKTIFQPVSVYQVSLQGDLSKMSGELVGPDPDFKAIAPWICHLRTKPT